MDGEYGGGEYGVVTVADFHASTVGVVKGDPNVVRVGTMRRSAQGSTFCPKVRFAFYFANKNETETLGTTKQVSKLAVGQAPDTTFTV